MVSDPQLLARLPTLVRSHAERLVRIHGRVASTVADFVAHIQRTIKTLAQSS